VYTNTNNNNTEQLLVLVYTNTNNCSVLYLYSFSDKLYPTWWWSQQHWPKHVADKLYTAGNIVVLW